MGLLRLRFRDKKKGEVNPEQGYITNFSSEEEGFREKSYDEWCFQYIQRDLTWV